MRADAPCNASLTGKVHVHPELLPETLPATLPLQAGACAPCNALLSGKCRCSLKYPLKHSLRHLLSKQVPTISVMPHVMMPFDWQVSLRLLLVLLPAMPPFSFTCRCLRTLQFSLSRLSAYAPRQPPCNAPLTGRRQLGKVLSVLQVEHPSYTLALSQAKVLPSPPPCSYDQVSLR